MKLAPRVGLVPLLYIALLLGGCNLANTSVNSTWSVPDAGKLRFKKVLVVAATPDGALRRSAEDAMKAEVLKAEAVASYALIGDAEGLKDSAKVLAMLKAGNFDGVIVVRLVSDRTEIVSTPQSGYPESYRMFRGYYSQRVALSPFYYDSGHISTNRIVQLETNIYEVANERLVWSGVTNTRNPSSVQELINESATAIRNALVGAAR